MRERRNYLYIGAHPDDPDVSFGGTAIQLARAGHHVKFVSMTNGDAGHYIMEPSKLAERRFKEAQAAARMAGVSEYEILPNHDSELMPTLENRKNLIRLIRRFRPDVIITHRTCDYHADHRATGQLVTDAAFLVGVPLCCPDTSPLEKVPIFCCSCDSFQKPLPFHPDAIISIDEVLEEKIGLLMCHESQFFEWLPWINKGIRDFDVSKLSVRQKRDWIFENWISRNSFAATLASENLHKFYGREVHHAEAFEISEYGRKISADEFQAVMMGK